MKWVGGRGLVDVGCDRGEWEGEGKQEGLVGMMGRGGAYMVYFG